MAIFQRGAADGLNIVVPHGDPRYYALRPTIAVPRPGAGENAALDLDGFFGLHPSLAPLKPLYDARVGSPSCMRPARPTPRAPTSTPRTYMESGTPGRKATGDGWLNRALAGRGRRRLARARRGHGARAAACAARAPSPPSPWAAWASSRCATPAAARAFEAAYAATGDAVLAATARETFEAVALLEGDPQAAAPRRRRVPALPLRREPAADRAAHQGRRGSGGGLRRRGRLGPPRERKRRKSSSLLRDCGAALAAFCRDLGGRMADVAVVTMSEFGRTARENGNRGTDHGHANCMFVMGGGVRGGKVYGHWPGLAPEQLYEGRDLRLTTDFRDVLGELTVRHLGNRGVEAVFPGYAARFPGPYGVRNARTRSPIGFQDIKQFVARVEGDQLRVRAPGRELLGIGHRHYFVAAAVQDQGGLGDVRVVLIALPVFDERPGQPHHALLAVMEDLQEAGALPAVERFRAQGFRPAPGEAERRRHQDHPAHFGVAGGVEGGQVTAHAGAHQDARLACGGVCDHLQLSGEGEVFEVAAAPGRGLPPGGRRPPAGFGTSPPYGTPARRQTRVDR